MASETQRLTSVCVFCGSSDAADPAFLEAASDLGRKLAAANLKLVYGGGGVGTLEEIVELLSWRRLDLHFKPVVFWNPRGFWDPLFHLFQHTVDERLTPPAFMDAWVSVEHIDEVIPALQAWGKQHHASDAAMLKLT